MCWLKKKKRRRSAVKRGYLTQQRNKTPPSFSSQPLHGNFITHQSQARFAHLVLLPSAFQPAEVLLETPNNALSCWSGLFNTRPLSPLLWLECSLLLEWRGRGTKRETRWQKERVIKKGRKQSVKERKDWGWREGERDRWRQDAEIGNPVRESARNMQVLGPTHRAILVISSFFLLIKVSSWLNIKWASREQRYGGRREREGGKTSRWGRGQRETESNTVSEREREREKSQHLQERSAGYSTVVPLRHKAQYDLWMTEVKEGWRKSRERRTKIDQRGWCARWTIKLGVRDRVSASQSSRASEFTASLAPERSHKTLQIHCCPGGPLTEQQTRGDGGPPHK